MKTMCLLSKKIGDISPKTGKQKSKPTYSRAKSEKSPRFMHKKTRNHPFTFSFFRPTTLPHARPPTEFSKHDYFSDDVNLRKPTKRGKKHENPSVTVPLTSSYANQRCCRHSQTAIALSIDADFPLGGATSTPIAADGGDPFPANAADPAFQIPSDTYSDSYLLVKYVQFRWL